MSTFKVRKTVGSHPYWVTWFKGEREFAVLLMPTAQSIMVVATGLNIRFIDWDTSDCECDCSLDTTRCFPFGMTCVYDQEISS